MKTFCPNCEKETDCNFDAELYSCNECEEDFASYEKYWKKQACAAVKHMLDMTSFLRHIMTLGLLRGSPRLTTRALEILDGFEASGVEDSATQDVLMDIKTPSDNNPDYNSRDYSKTSSDNNKLDDGSLEYAARWIENSLIGETNDKVIEFAKNMAMSIRAAKGG